MDQTLIVYEDAGWQRLLPLVYVRPVFDLLCGSMSLMRRVERLLAGGQTPNSDSSQSQAALGSASAPLKTVGLLSELSRQLKAEEPEDRFREPLQPQTPAQVEADRESGIEPLKTVGLLSELAPDLERPVGAGGVATGSRENGLPPVQGLQLWCRPLLAAVVEQQSEAPVNVGQNGPALFLNGRCLWTKAPPEAPGPWVGVCQPSGAVACIQADAELAARLSPEILLDEIKTRAALAGLPRRDVSRCATLIDWPWELVDLNSDLLCDDWRDEDAGVAGVVSPGSHLLNPGAIHVGWGTRIKPCAVIDAEDGPVWMGENVTIYPHTYIQGPAWIGDGSLIQPGAVIHAGTTIGPVSKIGGEIEGSIVQGYSNKQHDGFLGHSYVGSWVNIAADCINSDLKNTYGNIRVPINGREVETGRMFVGMFLGDYSKAGINVSFPTGSVIGFCSSVIAPRSPKFVPSFTWIDGDDVQRYDEQRGLAIARKVMARRRKKMSPAEEQVFLAVRKQALAVEKQTLMLNDPKRGRQDVENG